MRNVIYKLRWRLERVTKTDLAYLTKGGSWLLSGNVATIILGILLAMVFARVLPKEFYGNYQYIISLAGLISILHLHGIGVAIKRSVARGYEGIVRRGISLFAKWSLVASGLTLIIALYYFFNNDFNLALSLVIVSIGLPIWNSTRLFNSFLIGRREFKVVTKYMFISILVPTVLLIVVATLKNDSVPLLVLTYFVGHGAINYLTLKHTLRRFPPNDKLDEADVSFGKHMSVMRVFATAIEHIDKVLIFHFLGAVPVAVYAFATAVPLRFRGLYEIVDALVFPKLSANRQSRSFKNIFYKTILFTLAAVALVGVYILLAPLLFSILFPAYEEAVVYSQVFALALAALALGSLPIQALQAGRAQKHLYAQNIIVPLVNILLLIVLIPLYGLWGAIFARIIGNAFGSLLALTLLYIYKPGMEANAS